MKVTSNTKILVKRDRILTDNENDFYHYWRNVITEINTLFDEMRNAINYEAATAEFNRTTNLTPSSADTWESLAWDDQQTLNQRIKLLDNNQEIEIHVAGWYMLNFNVMWENTAGSSLKAIAAHRLLKNGSEIGGSQVLEYVDRSDGAMFNLSNSSTLIKFSQGDKLQLQYYSGDTDLIISAASSVFDGALAASLFIRELEST